MEGNWIYCNILGYISWSWVGLLKDSEDVPMFPLPWPPGRPSQEPFKDTIVDGLLICYQFRNILLPANWRLLTNIIAHSGEPI